jgi:hypothetical protein
MLDPITLMDELDTYGFNCEAGSLEWAPLWIDLRRAVIALRQAEPETADPARTAAPRAKCHRTRGSARTREDVID